MIRFDNNGNPIEDEGSRTKRSYGSAGNQPEYEHEDNFVEAEVSETIIDSNINNATQFPIEQINGFEVARRAVVNECRKKDYPVTGAVLGGLGYALESFFFNASPPGPKGRHYGS